MRIVPGFPSPTMADPATWDDLSLLAATVYLEAEGEPFEGKLAVGWVVRNRMTRWRKGLHETVLQRWQFSCWNEDYEARADARLSGAQGLVAADCWRAAAGAYWEMEPSPVGDATHYANLDQTRRLHKGSLPAWLDEAIAKGPVWTVGEHTFVLA